MEEKLKGNRRRRERAKKIRDELTINTKDSDDSCEELPLIRTRRHRSRKRNKEPIFEEDFIDGFAIVSFRSYEDLEGCLHEAGKGNSYGLNPDWKKCVRVPKRSSLAKTAVGTHYNTEDGYICDRESEDDKISDVDEMSYSPCIDLAINKQISATGISNIALDNEMLLSSTNIVNSLKTDDPGLAQVKATPVTTSSDILTSTSDAPIMSKIKEEIPFNCHPPCIVEHNSHGIDKKPDLSSCKIFDDKRSIYINQKYSTLDQKPVIDRKPPIFSSANPCPQISCSNLLFQPNFNTFTTTNNVTNSSTITSTTTTSSTVSSVMEPVVNHKFHCPTMVTSQSVSAKSKFTVSSLVSKTNYIGNSNSPVDPVTIIKPQTLKSCPTLGSSIPLPVNNLHTSSQNINKIPPLPIKSPTISCEEKRGAFATISATYSSESSLIPLSSSYPVFPNNKTTPITSYPFAHNANLKIEPGECSAKQPSKVHSKVKPNHIFGPPPSICHPNFGVMSSNLAAAPQLKTHSSISNIMKRDPSSGTHIRPIIPHSNYASRYSPRLQDSHSSLYNSPASLCSNRFSNFQSTSGALSNFPLPTQISAPLPPSGVFTPHPSAPGLAVPPILGSANSLVQDPIVAQADLLRRELDSRFLATQDRTAVSMAATGFGTLPTLLRTDVHHHQHQHTHVHQHLLPSSLVPSAPSGIFSHSSATPSLFKEVSKVGMESGLYHQRNDLGSFSSGLSPLIPVNNSSPLVPSQMAPVTKKTGQWNAMHVRIAWEIFYDQQKQAGTKGMKVGSSDILRSGPGVPSLYPSLSRPSDLLEPMGVGGGSPHILEDSSFFTAPHVTPSVSGFPYAATATTSHNSAFPTSAGPHPGSMFSRESAPLSIPTAPHDPWRIGPAIPFGNSTVSPWHRKTDLSYFENERREQSEKERRYQQEKERKKLREEQERREEKEKRDREEKKREREKRAEHEKGRLSRLDMYKEYGSFGRGDSRSPLRLDSKESHNMSVMHNSRPSSSTRYDSTKDEITIVGSKEGNRKPLAATASHLGVPPASSSFLGSHSSSAVERTNVLGSGYHLSPGTQPMTRWTDPLRDPYRAAVASAQEQFAVVRGHDFAVRESLLSRDHFRDPLRDSLDRAREEQMMCVNPLGTMILNERYREQHAAREIIERERHYVAAAAANPMHGGFYPHSSILPHPSVSAAMLPAPIKTASSLGHTMVPNPSLHPQSLGFYPTPYLGHHALPPGMPPPLISSIAMQSQNLCRPLDKKDVPK